MKNELFDYYEKEIYRGLRLFGWSNDNKLMLKQAYENRHINAEEYEKLLSIHNEASKDDIYQF